MTTLFDEAIHARLGPQAITPDTSHDADPDPRTRYVRAVWRDIVRTAQDRPVYLYGAGAHTEWLLDAVADLPKPNIACIIDDQPRVRRLAGHDVRATSSETVVRGSVVLISSDRFERQLFCRANELFGGRARIVRLYEGLPPGPYAAAETSDQIQRRRAATQNARRRWGGSEVVGPYEQAGYVTGFLHEQWLWSQRTQIRGRVLDMSTPRHWHGWVYKLNDVTRVWVSDLDKDVVTKLGHASQVDIKADFCDLQLTLPPDSFDTVICASILEHCHAPSAMMANLHRLLSPGGALLANVPFVCPDSHDRPDYWRFGCDGLAMLARNAGFEHVSTFTLGDIHFVLDDILGEPRPVGSTIALPLLTALAAKKLR